MHSQRKFPRNAPPASHHRYQTPRARSLAPPPPNLHLAERQYSDEFEEPIVSFIEQDENGEEPSVSHDGSRVLEDLLAQVGKVVLPAISSSDDDEDQILARYDRHSRGVGSSLRRSSRHAHSDGDLPDQHLFPDQDAQRGRSEVDCRICRQKISSNEELQSHIEWHARHGSSSSMDLDDEREDLNFFQRQHGNDTTVNVRRDHHHQHHFYHSDLEHNLRRRSEGDRRVGQNDFVGSAMMAMIPRRGPTMMLDIPRDITNMVFDYLHPMDWTRSCALVNKFFWNVSLFKWGRVDIYALQGLSSKKQRGEECRAKFLGRRATRLKTLIIENCGIEASSFITLTGNLRRLQVLVLEWSPRVLMDVVLMAPLSSTSNPSPSISPRLRVANGSEQEDAVMVDLNSENDSRELQVQQQQPNQLVVQPQHQEMRIDWDELENFPGQLRVVIVRGIGPHISSSAFRWLLSNSHQSLQHLTISRKDPTRCQRPGCGACTLWKFQACAQCKMATYCSRRCQKRHWRNHKSICQECAKSPRDRMVFDDVLLGSIIQCTNLIRLDLSRTFRLDDRQLVTIAQHCPKLIDVSLDGNHHISDRGVEPFVRSLPKLHTLRLNVCSHIGNQTIEALSQTCAEHLTVLELGCCYRVSESALMDLVVSCTKLQSLNIACGFQRRQILWNFSDELALLILDHLVHLKVLYVVSTISLSDEVRRKLDDHENLRVYSALTLAPPLDPHQVHHVDHPGT